MMLKIRAFILSNPRSIIFYGGSWLRVALFTVMAVLCTQIASADVNSDYLVQREAILSGERTPEESLLLMEMLSQDYKKVTGETLSLNLPELANKVTRKKNNSAPTTTDEIGQVNKKNIAQSDNTSTPVKQLLLNQPVIDQANLLTIDKKQALVTILRSWYEENLVQAAIVIVPTTGNEPIFDYGMQIAERWQLGSKKHDDGLLILVAVNDRKMHIFTGYGLEGILPDVVLKRIIREDITPQFKRGDYFAGLQAGLVVIQERLTADPDELQKKDKAQVVNDDWDGFSLIFIGIFTLALSSSFKVQFGRLVGSVLTAGIFSIVLVIAGFPSDVIIFSSVIVFGIAVIGFVSGGGSGGSFGGSSGGFSSSSYSGGYSSGSSSSYSGGGGSFGGGGAGGSW